MAATPQFIPIKKGKEWSTVASWRESPSIRPRDAPKATPPPSPQPTQPAAPGEKGGRRRGKSQGPEETFNDYMVKTALGDGFTRGEAERALTGQGLRPLRCIRVPAAQTIPMTRTHDLKGGPAPDNKAPEVDAFRSPQPGTVPDMDDDGMGLPEMTLPPSIPSDALDTQELHYFFLSSAEETERAVKILQTANSGIAAEAVTRKRALLNSTLVIKNLPFNLQLDNLIDAIEGLENKPSYLRLHRGERGLFKCVMFVKYPNRIAAECSKLELDRLTIGHKPLKIEFKKKSRTVETTSSQGKGAAAASQPSFAGLEKAVKDLRESNENEGFFYAKTALQKDEVKYLKQLCTNFDLVFDSNEEKITVKRKTAGASSSASVGGTSSKAASVSPAMKPTTPPWAPATPGSLQPMEFRGIRHWKEMRQKAGSVGPGSGDPSGLPVHRPNGVADAAAFSAGRGRPVAKPAA